MSISRFFLSASFLCLIACGDEGEGGGGTGDSDDGNGFDPPEDTAQPMEYEGNTDAAALNTTNVGDFIYRALTETRRASELDRIRDFKKPDSGITAVSNSEGDKLLRPTKADNAGFSIAAVSDSYDEAKVVSRDCESGRIDFYLMVNYNANNTGGTGRNVIDYNDCLEDGLLTAGLVTEDIHDYEPVDGIILNSTLRFNRMTFNVNGVDFIRSGTIESENNGWYADEWRYVMNVVYNRMDTGAMYWRQNMTYEWNEVAQYWESISGRFYDGFYGYVDVTTPQILEFHDGNGKLMLAGASNSTALLEFIPGIAVDSLKLDADGDGAYETTAILNRDSHGSELSADIGDDDGDGMHNSWETYYGLDPQNSGDATLDPDGDTISNLDEYLAGTSPL